MRGSSESSRQILECGKKGRKGGKKGTNERELNEKQKRRTKMKKEGGGGGREGKTIGTFVEHEARGFDFVARGKKGGNNGRRGIYFAKAKPSFIRADA